MQTGNKGEWSEFYTFIKLLAEKKIVGADKDLKKIESVFFPILKIIREEPCGISEYELQGEDKVKVMHAEKGTFIVDSSDLKRKVVDVFNEIKDGSGSFAIPLTDELLERFGVTALNAGNSQKEDLILRVHDYTMGAEHNMGFSIKSELGNAPTLLNASEHTNFTYRIKNLDPGLIEKINGIQTRSKIRDRVNKIYDEGGSLEFFSTDSEVFERNLRKVDTVMPEIAGEIVLAFFSGKGKNLRELVQSIAENNFQTNGYDLSLEDCAYKVKGLLIGSAFGMVASKPWDGELRAHGGFIVVREDGEIVCYHLYNAKAFQDHLFDNTKLETASSTRHKYGTIYKESNELFIKLNLQIRFTS